MSIIQKSTEALKRWLTQPAEELSRFQRTVRWGLDLFRHCARELYHDRATEMAAALTYRTIFSLVPVLVIGLLVFNAMGGFRSFGSEVQDKLYEYLGISQIALPHHPAPADASQASEPATTGPGRGSGETDQRATETPATEPSATQPLVEEDASAEELATEQKLRVDSLINQFTEKVGQLNFKSIGAVGVILLIWAALALVITVEDAFNRIYGCEVGRAWRMRIPIYWAVLTLGPVLFGGSLWLSSFILGLAAQWGLGWFVSQATQLGALLLSWLLLYLLYTLMPNTHVARRPALIGSFVAAIFFEQGKALFGLYVKNSVMSYQIYGSLALLPIFLFWVYITWLIVLFGLELTYTLQAMKNRRFKHRDALDGVTVQGNPQWLIPLLVRIGESFSLGKPSNMDELCGDLNLPADVVKDLIKQLEKQGLIHRVQTGKVHETAYMLSRPPQSIQLDRLLELTSQLTLSPARSQGLHQPKAGWSLIQQLGKEQQQSVQNTTLADLLARNG